MAEGLDQIWQAAGGCRCEDIYAHSQFDERLDNAMLAAVEGRHQRRFARRKALQDEAIGLLFGADGARLAMGRIPIGASDYALERYTLASHRKRLRVVPAALGEQAGVIGAGLLAWQAQRTGVAR